MANYLSNDEQREVERRLRAGESIRGIAAAVGCAQNTVSRYRRVLDVVARCECGLDARHNGWCAWRYRRSEARQRWMRVWMMPSKLLGKATEIRERFAAGESMKALAREFDVSSTTIWQCVNCTDAEPRTCEQCGIEFVPVYTGHFEFCSMECYRVLQDASCAGCGAGLKVSRGQVRFNNFCDDCRATRRERREDKRQWQNGVRTLKHLRKVLRDRSHLQSEAFKQALSSHR